MKPASSKDSTSASELITRQIADLGDWRGKLLARLRKVILAAGPGLTEEWKWGTGVWSHNGNVLSVGVFKDHLKINFFRGAALNDPTRLFNAGLEAKATRAIDFFEGDKIDEPALKKLVEDAIAFNSISGKRK